MADKQALKKHSKELDRIMPRISSWHSFYSCRICGSVVNDRNVHLRWHRGSDMLDVLTTLFGRP